MDAAPDITLDLRGLKCPWPALRVRKALLAARPGTRFRVACTDPLAALDVPNTVRETGDVLEETSREGVVVSFVISKAVP